MIDERAFLAQLESANTDELSQILRRPSVDEERLLEIYFGAERLHRLRSLALGARRRAVPKGNVVVLHGIMGGELTVFPKNENSQFIWLNFPRVAIGAVGWLRMTGKFESPGVEHTRIAYNPERMELLESTRSFIWGLDNLGGSQSDHKKGREEKEQVCRKNRDSEAREINRAPGDTTCCGRLPKGPTHSMVVAGGSDLLCCRVTETGAQNRITMVEATIQIQHRTRRSFIDGV